MLLALLLLATPPTVVDCTGGARCAVDVDVNGTRLSLIVDTGADTVLLNREGMRKAGVRVGDDSAIVPIQGVTGGGWAVLTFGTVKVGGLEERGVRVLSSPGVEQSGYDGLLGMSYLERFRFTLRGKTIELLPIDDGELPRHGERGKSWWQIRFGSTEVAVGRYESMLAAAKDLDERTAKEYGTSPGEMSMADLVKRLRKVMEDERRSLDSAAANGAVPMEWRR